MTSTYSTSLRLELMATGDQSGTWGDTTNTNLGTLLEQAITGVLSVAQGDVANLTLTSLNGASDQARNAVVNLTGALTAARNVVVPTANKVYLIKNSTTGGFNITVKTSAGTGVEVGPLTARWVYCDGTNVVDGLPGVGYGYATTATAAGTTTLTVGSAATQFFTGATTQTLQMPVTSTLVLGQAWRVVNNSTGVVTVNSSGSNAIVALAAGTEAIVTCILLSGTSAASWSVRYIPVTSNANSGNLTVPSGNLVVSAGTASVASTAAGTLLTLTSTDAGATAGPVVDLYRDSASPAVNDILGNITFNGRDSAGNKQEYGSLEIVIVDPVSTTEDGSLNFYVTKAGTRTLFASMTATVTAFTGAASYTFDAAVSVGTTNPITAGTIELGAVADTTISRGAAGFIAVEGNRVPSPASQVSGDVLYRGASEWERLPKGTASQVLAMNAGATAPEWATPVSGGMTLLGTINTTSGSSQSLSGLDLTGYKQVLCELAYVSGSASSWNLELNSLLIGANTTSSANGISGEVSIDLTTGVATYNTACTNAAGTTKVGTPVTGAHASGLTTASTSITFTLSTGSFDAGSIRIYGVK